MLKQSPMEVCLPWRNLNCDLTPLAESCESGANISTAFANSGRGTDSISGNVVFFLEK